MFSHLIAPSAPRLFALTSLVTATLFASPIVQQRALTSTKSGPGSAAVTNRPVLPPGSSNWVPQEQKFGPGITTQDLSMGVTPADLVTTLVGPGVSVSNITFMGANVAAGKFSGGLATLGFNNGIVLSSGNIATIKGPNNLLDNASTNNGQPGDTDLNALIPGFTTFDRTKLEFDFECPNTSVISFQFVFASDEYNEYVNSTFNDVFAFFLNGTNIALIPSTVTPVAINNVNCNNPYNPPTGANCALFRNNDCSNIPPFTFPCAAIASEMDGMTVVFSATGTLLPGTNHIKLAIADAGDAVLDSNVCIRSQSFVCATPGPVFDEPSPCDQMLGASVGVPFSFNVVALATNGLPGQSVTLSQSGAPVGSTFAPPLPAGPAQPVSTTFNWTPTNADVGVHVITFTVVDQLGQTNTCTVTVAVAECHLLLGQGAGHSVVNIGGVDYMAQMSNVVSHYPVTMVDMPAFPMPTRRLGANGLWRIDRPLITTAQVVMHNPDIFPDNPSQWSQRMSVYVAPNEAPIVTWDGSLNGITITYATFMGPDGKWYIRFPFGIDGM